VEAGGEWFYVVDRRPATTEAGTIGIVRYDASGAALGRIAIPYKPVPVDRAALQRFAEVHASAVTEKAPPWYGTISADAVMKALWIPRNLPPVSHASADAGGFWLARESAPVPGADIRRRWERYDLQGNLVASVELPSGVVPLAAVRQTLFGSRLDSLTVPEVHRYDVILDDSARRRRNRLK
jgi:hypothetical protein